MRLRRLRITEFRHIVDREVTFEDGVTIVEGPNEIGKSALAAALKLLLDSKIKHTSQAASILREKPANRDAWPTIEAEMECGALRFVFRKRFARGAAGGTELEELAPRTETHTGDDAYGRLDEILGEEVDLPLFQALQVVQGDGVVPLATREHRWLTDALDDAAGGDQTGEDHEPLFTRARVEYELWFTPKGRDRENSDLQRLRTRSSNAAAATERAESALRAARDAVDELERIQRKVQEADQRLPELIAECERTESALTELSSKDDQLSGLRETLSDKLELAERLAKTRTTREERATLLVTTEKELAAAERELQSLEREAETASEVYEKAEAAAVVARRASERASELRKLRESDLDTALREQSAEKLQRDRCRAEELLAELAPIEQLAKREIDRDAIQAVTRASANLDAARAAAARGAPSVEIEALDDISIELDDRTTDLTRGSTVAPELRDQLEIRIPDRVAIRLSAGTSNDDLRAAVERAEIDVTTALSAVGATTADEAQQLWAEVSAARAKLAPSRQRIEDLRAGLPDSERGVLATFDDAIAAAQDFLDAARTTRPKEPEPPSDAAVADRLVTEAREAERLAIREADARRSAGDAAREAHQELRTEVSTQRAALGARRQNLEQDEKSLSAERKRESDDDLAADVARTNSDARSTEQLVQRLADELAKADLDGKRQAASNARRVVQDRRRDLDGLRADRDRLRGRVEELGGQGLFESLEECQGVEAEIGAELEREERRASAARRLFDTLSECRGEAHAGYRSPLCERIQKLARPIFGGDLAIELGDDLGIAARTLDGTKLPFTQLSVGAREQLDLVHRIAVADLVADKGGVPLILDDSLGSADPERLRAMNLLLAHAGERVQIIVLTCHPERFDQVGGSRTVRLDR